jgi:hypothetical protein
LRHAASEFLQSFIALAEIVERAALHIVRIRGFRVNREGFEDLVEIGDGEIVFLVEEMNLPNVLLRSGSEIRIAVVLHVVGELGDREIRIPAIHVPYRILVEFGGGDGRAGSWRGGGAAVGCGWRG